MQNKEYNIKIYTLAGVFIRVFSAKKQMADFSFSESLNAGQGELRLKLDYEFADTDVQYNQIIKVYESDKDHAARCIYTGVIANLRRVFDSGAEYLEVRAVGLASMMTWFYYQSGAAYAFNKNLAPDVILKDIVDYFTTLYPNLISYTGASVEAGGTVTNIAFSYNKCLEALQNVATTAANFWWAIDATGLLQFHPTVGSAYATYHDFTMGVNVDKLIVEENTEKLVNKYLLAYNGGSTSATDATSVTNNGLRELRETRTEINDGTTANTAAAAYIAQNKDYKRRIQVTINEQYDIESIHAGHFITISNLDYSITTLQVQKLQYNIDNVELELEDVTSFAKEVFT